VRGLLAVLAVVVLSACTLAPIVPAPSPAAPSGVPSATATVTHGSGGGPSFEVRYGDTALVVYAVTFCTSGGGVSRCVDGVDEAPPRIGSSRDVFVRVSVAEFDKLEVSLSPSQGSGSASVARVERLGERWWRVRPSGPAGVYRVSLFASGNQAGDMAADMIWDVKGP